LARLEAGTPLADIFARACKLAAEALDVERVGVWLFIEEGRTLRCATLYEKSKDAYSEGALLRSEDFPNYFSSLTIRKAIPAEFAATDAWTEQLAAAYLNPLGITSLLDAGIFVDSTLVGVVCHEHVGPPREWTTEARDFAGSMADLLAMKIQSAEAREQRAAFRTQRDRLAALEKAAALEQMAAGVAHDFKNLLGVFLGNGELLCERTDLPDEARIQCEDIVNAANRGLALVTELMEFAEPSDRAPAVLNLAAATEEFLSVLRAAVGRRHEVEFLAPPAIGQVLLDRTQFTRVLLNLVVNARDAMPDGGPIQIRIAPVKLMADFGPCGNFVLLEVIDRGDGMDEAARRRALEPFYTTKTTGTGLGLAIVQRIVDRAGGHLSIESKPGFGSTFRAFFPRVGASAGGTAEFKIPPEFRKKFAKS
jgi:signal transduction histidine kinase